ncbi:DIL domain-containing protein [Dioszegia hungarica]|uniref:DIL domain-containing protein n=1 Tax=Dioszegia hungarica TaxID=4972 RepID=A0AA38LSW4_9TREE|nr:DIL domain-containing protein [Dioszegia hungarica]KAI9633838.1 DIL domain-containing protein [Dioszegia hungarica]
MAHLNHHDFPDSPLIVDTFVSPELRGEASSSSLAHALTPPTFLPTIAGRPSPEIILSLLQEEEERDQREAPTDKSSRGPLVLRHALQWGIEHGDVELVDWLAELTGRWGSVLDAEVAIMEDEEGWGLIGMAVQASCGRQDKEELVRVAVGRWGIQCGPRGGRDRTGWTPLHLSALISTPPLISFLLTRGASPNDMTNRGLTPLDLVAGMPDRMHISALLEQASNQGTSASALVPAYAKLSEGRQRLLRRRRDRAGRESSRQEERERRKKREAERERWVREKVEIIGIDPGILFPPGPENTSASSRDSGIDMTADSDDSDAEESGTPASSGRPSADPTDELVFAPANLPAIFDTIITSYQPVCQPLSRRALPANMIYLYARFAVKQCSVTWLEELLEGAVDRIEKGVYGSIEDLAYLAFWAYNTTLLLYLLVSDDELRTPCDELGLLGMVEELINAIHVFVIRVAERRIDQVLDGAILDFETLEDFDDVRFEGEWTLFRTFGTKKQRASILPKASQVFNDAVSAATNDSISMPPPSSPGLSKPNPNSPTQVTDILTSVLVVLHLYDVNPAITAQAFSQVFFWIAAELFNRILSRKKYLCRSKAVQIRMNITALDDWVRLHGLPAKTAVQHFEPVLQLLQWLQTQSNIHAFDDLIGTVQGLRRLNPLQMRRAVRDYKFEVSEGRMDDECVAYMGQIQKDWENRRVQTSVKALKAEQEGGKEVGRPGTSVDALFDGSVSLADFVPSSGPESYGELLDSRFMLPFQLPDDPNYLIATPAQEAIYTNFTASSPFLSDDRSASRTSFSSTRRFEYTLPSRDKLRRIPDDFFAWLKAQEAGRRHPAQSVRTPASMSSAVMPAALDLPLGQSDQVAIHSSRSSMASPKLPSVQENGSFGPPPIRPVSISSTLHSSLLPSPGIRTSPLVNQLPDQAQRGERRTLGDTTVADRLEALRSAHEPLEYRLPGVREWQEEVVEGEQERGVREFRQRWE